jgi:hypothetical protein
LNPVLELLKFLDQSGPGHYVVITGELARIFPPPLRFKYGEYASEIRSFLSEIELEHLIRLDIPNKTLFDSTFGDLNNIFCNLENHEIRAKITREGLDYLAGAAIRSTPSIAIGANAQLIVNSPGANNISSGGPGNITVDSRSGNAVGESKKKANKIVQFLTDLADSLGSLKIALASLLVILGSFGAKLMLSRSKSLAAAALPGFRYISPDSLPKMSKTDLIQIAWIPGHHDDFIIAEQLQADLKLHGYQTLTVQLLVSPGNIEFEGRPYKVESFRQTVGQDREDLGILEY